MFFLFKKKIVSFCSYLICQNIGGFESLDFTLHISSKKHVDPKVYMLLNLFFDE